MTSLHGALLLAAAVVLLVDVASAADHNVDVAIDLTQTHAVSDKLFGIFFEEINHAGEGGLYAELVQDRSFDALALTTGFSASAAPELLLTSTVLEAAGRPIAKSSAFRDANNSQHIAGAPTLKQQIIRENANSINQPVSWRPLGSASLELTRSEPLSSNNLVAMKLGASKPGDGLSNSGYWGVPLRKGWTYHYSLYLKGDPNTKVRIALESADGASTYGSMVLEHLEQRWQKYSGNLTSSATDFKAVLTLRLPGQGAVVVDSLSLFPAQNLRPGWQNPFPFREDLLQALRDLWPKFLRFPGGCYVEGGDWLKNRFPWRTNLGPNENRTGHLNDVWGYWSTDGLGLYEYMLLAEEVRAEPIYVVNNGVSHQESVAPADLQPYIEEAMDALEFLTGPPSSRWGAERAAMGRQQPWTINYVAVGNEDCGRPNYVENYNAFYTAIKATYPHVTLIANCPMLDAAPTDLWDWHSYDDAWTMFGRSHEFDAMDRAKQPPVFVSEYAVTADGGWGNLRGAVAEASFMTGLERNSDLVKLASYAPLFVHTENRIWPTNMIVIDNHRYYKTPSYLVQQLFSHSYGVIAAAVKVTTELGDLHNELVSASATCQDTGCGRVVVKLVNFNSYRQPVALTFAAEGTPAFEESATLYHVSGEHPEAENSFEHPDNVIFAKENLRLQGSVVDGKYAVRMELPPWSACGLEMRRKPHHTQAAAAA